MKIGIISDTHGHVGHTMSAVEVLLDRGIKTVLHCGDIGSPEVVELLAGFETHFVFGNCDWDPEPLQYVMREMGLSCHGQFGDLTIANRRIGLIHSHDPIKFRAVKSSGEYDLVCYGHTHATETHHEGRTLVLNPGALYRVNRHTIAIVDLETMQVEIIGIDKPGL
ncbi:metallophosphoesterase family protein [Lacunimicrobium album]